MDLSTGWGGLVTKLLVKFMHSGQAASTLVCNTITCCLLQLNDCHCFAFPSLSKLTSLDEEIIREVLCQCGLVQYRSNTGYYVMPMEWTEFIREYELEEVDVLHFFIMHKKKIYIWLGSWCSDTPAEVWSNAWNDSIYAPRLRFSSLGNEFAKNIGDLGILVPTTVADDVQNPLSESESDDRSIESTSDLKRKQEQWRLS
jgi:hypothetical protein